ncbi:hypothetical protein [Pseudomonas typographi]|uniref:hypothetical protein n=1 Tax=Pseudomonas typographi TaxID=2715964 RepID=UPI0016861C95|nr:hypothetical protein [Pseudomonas typographi]MBD1589498.1 hypothetical protein [Pseudomonas typographi]
MSQETIREEFEVAFVEKTASLDALRSLENRFGDFKALFAEVLKEDRRGHTYRADLYATAWWAWQASRAAVVVERPEKCEFAEPGGAYEKGYRQGLRDMIDAIEASGMKVRRPVERRS